MELSKSILTKLIIGSFIVTIVSCESSNDSHQIHPNSNLVFHDGEKYKELSISNLTLWENEFKFNISDTVTIDISEQKYKIESVADALIVENEVLVLDDGTTTIQSISFNGSPNKTVARKGRGPGEIASPVNMVKMGDGFVVMDRVNGIIYYDKNKEPTKAERIKFMPDYFCMNENYFVKSSYFSRDNNVDNHLIFEINSESKIIQRYSRKYDHEDNMLVYLMSYGPIKCINQYNMLVNAYTVALPLIEFYNTEKQENRNYKLTDINPYPYEFKGNLKRANVKRGTTHHRSGNLSVLRDRFVILQFYEMYHPNNPDSEFKPKILSYIFDLKSNAIHYSYSLPYIRATSKNKLFVKNHTDEFTYFLYTYKLGQI